MDRINKFYKILLDLEKNDGLNIENIKTTIDLLAFDNSIKEDLIERLYTHKECNKDENYLTVANYADGYNLSLECEGCYSVIIDSETLEMMLEEE